VNLVDLVVALTALAYAVGGYRNGAVVGACSLVGLFGGAIVGAQVARPLGSRLAGGQAQIPVAIVCVLAVAVLGQLAGAWIGAALRRHLTWRPARAIDSIIGTLLGVLSVLLVAWMVALPLAASPYPKLVSELHGSTIVRGVDDAMPDTVRNVYSSLRRFIDRSGFPPLFGDFSSPRIVDVLPPDTRLLRDPAVTAAQPSVLKILSEAPSCGRGIEGSGFVYAPHRIVTNAHVVAGADSVEVQQNGRGLPADVVVFDPRRDVAVLDVPGLSAPPLSFAAVPGRPNDNALVLGYPENGGFDVRAARLRGRETVLGHDIYGSGTIDRDIYAVRSVVRSGNSGGPLLAANGQVLGLVFATALDSPDTGFALTDAEIAADVTAGRTASAPVGTGNCD
jgi:S1-C subfamily serine protease